MEMSREDYSHTDAKIEAYLLGAGVAFMHALLVVAIFWR